MIHACGQVELVRDLAYSPEAVASARKALLAGAPVSPLIIAFVTSMAAMVYVLPFQLPTVMAAEGIAEGKVDHKDVMPSAWAYILINMIAVAASVPWWTALGLIG